MSNDSNTDKDSMHRAYQQFMMTGQKEKPNSSALSSPVPSNSGIHTGPIPTPSNQRIPVALIKDYWRYIKSFQLTMQQEWIQIDDIMFQVCESISNLRHRIYLESRHVAVNHESQDWKCYGLKHSRKTVLTHDDVNMALSHDLIKHESMMSKLKSLMASLSQGQAALGRRFEQLLTFHMGNMEKIDMSLITQEEPTILPLVQMDERVSTLGQVLNALATELYRKQCLAQKLLNSCTDDLIYNPETSSSSPESSPRVVAEECVKDWPRGSSKSLVRSEWLENTMALSPK